MKKLILSFVSLAILGGIALLFSCTEDTTPPVVTITGDNPLTIVLNTATTDPGATATDDKDGDVTASITSDWSSTNPDVNKLGSYTITYSATDEAGNIGTETRTVKVIMTKEKFQATWHVDETVAPGSPNAGTYSYDVTISPSGTYNDRVLINLLGNYCGSYSVYMTFTEFGSLTIPNQNVTVGGGTTTNFSGNGNLQSDGKKFTLNYNVEFPGQGTDVTSGTYTKQ